MNDPVLIGSRDSDAYYEDTVEEWQRLEEQREELALRQQALKQLDNEVAQIDCDIGSGSLEISDEGIIHVRTSTPDMCDEVEALVHNYSWSRESAISYDTRSRCVQWSLKTDIATLVGDVHRQIME